MVRKGVEKVAARPMRFAQCNDDIRKHRSTERISKAPASFVTFSSFHPTLSSWRLFESIPFFLCRSLSRSVGLIFWHPSSSRHSIVRWYTSKRRTTCSSLTFNPTTFTLFTFWKHVSTSRSIVSIASSPSSASFPLARNRRWTGAHRNASAAPGLARTIWSWSFASSIHLDTFSTTSCGRWSSRHVSMPLRTASLHGSCSQPWIL
mmetsp:Transcript_3680/g.23072  ORF Transcript_3680/g.23072 Transcript_3680/m.23072 type:complete len:205 (+) Transcript_3680:2646-3260(+)